MCDVLTIGNTSMAAGRLDDDEKHNLSQTEVGENQGLMDNGGRSPIVISESGLYRLVLRSDKPQAKPFQKWVTGTVLPSIRKTGSYAAPSIAAGVSVAQVEAASAGLAAAFRWVAVLAVAARQRQTRHPRAQCSAGNFRGDYHETISPGQQFSGFLDSNGFSFSAHGFENPSHCCPIADQGSTEPEAKQAERATTLRGCVCTRHPPPMAANDTSQFVP